MPFIKQSFAYDASGNLLKTVKRIVDKKGKTKFILTRSEEDVKKKIKTKKRRSSILIERGVYTLFGE